MANRAGLPAIAALLALASANATADLIVSEGTNLAVDVSPVDGSIVMDLLGNLWVLPSRGGRAEQLAGHAQSASRPRWSPDGEKILYHSVPAEGSRIYVHDLSTSSSRRIGEGRHFDQHAAWHPEGKRIVFSSARHASGFDLWETDLATSVSWRLTHRRGDESEPAWSADGRHLAYIHEQNGRWRLVVRRHGQAEEDLVVSDEPLAAPSWRPDGSLLTYLRGDGKGYALDMIILSDPPIVRTLAEHQDFFLAPVAWVDRLHFLYTADGVIKSHGINEWQADQVAFTASVDPAEQGSATAVATRPLPVVTPPENRLVIRATRLYDGIEPGYRRGLDILIEGGTITEVTSRRDWGDATVIDLDATALPGFVDAYSRFPAGDPYQAGLRMLTFGVTTAVAEAPAEFDVTAWESEATPGPRLLRAATLGAADAADETAEKWSLIAIPASGGASPPERGRIRAWQERGVPVLAESWRIGRSVGADISVGGATLPESPLGRRYQDLRQTAGAGPASRVSGLADAATPGVAELLQSRQAQALGPHPPPARRYAEPPALYGAATSVVAGSKPNGLPPGLALHAELRALTAAGFSGTEALQAAGRNAARALGVQGRLGHIAPGAVADLVLVDGDPLEEVEDAIKIVAVVRNGRFYSLVRLLEEAAKPTVE